MALLEVELARHGLQRLVLLRIAPPARPVAERGEPGARLDVEDEGRAEDVPELGLAAALDHGRPVGDLEVGLEPHLLELALHDEGGLVVVLVLGGDDPPDRLPLIPGLADETPRLLLVPLVVKPLPSEWPGSARAG
jgi:hypothetical protein